MPGLSAYTASRHGVSGLTESVGLKFATRNIRVNAIAPGGTNTEMIAAGTVYLLARRGSAASGTA